MSTGDGSSSLPAGIDARCHKPRKTTSAISRQPVMLIRSARLGRRRARESGNAVDSAASTDAAGNTSAACTLIMPYRCKRLVGERQAELRLVGDHAPDAAPEVCAAIDELVSGAEVVVPAWACERDA